jgi:hypothetical protein
MTMVTKIMLHNLFNQLNMTWCQVLSKTIMCNDHMDLHLK